MTIFGLGVCGDGDDGGGVGESLTDLAGSLIAVDVGHIAVHEDEVIGVGSTECDGAMAVVCDVDMTGESLKEATSDALTDTIVFGDEDPPARGR